MSQLNVDQLVDEVSQLYDQVSSARKVGIEALRKDGIELTRGITIRQLFKMCLQRGGVVLPGSPPFAASELIFRDSASARIVSDEEDIPPEPDTAISHTFGYSHAVGVTTIAEYPQFDSHVGRAVATGTLTHFKDSTIGRDFGSGGDDEEHLYQITERIRHTVSLSAIDHNEISLDSVVGRVLAAEMMRWVDSVHGPQEDEIGTDPDADIEERLLAEDTVSGTSLADNIKPDSIVGRVGTSEVPYSWRDASETDVPEYIVPLLPREATKSSATFKDIAVARTADPFVPEVESKPGISDRLGWLDSTTANIVDKKSTEDRYVWKDTVIAREFYEESPVADVPNLVDRAGFRDALRAVIVDQVIIEEKSHYQDGTIAKAATPFAMETPNANLTGTYGYRHSVAAMPSATNPNVGSQVSRAVIIETSPHFKSVVVAN